MAQGPLVQLLLALFDSSSELRRFLSLAGFEAVEHQLPATKGESIRTTAFEAGEALEQLDLVQLPLFEALVRRAPERAEDIWAVARAYGVEPGESGADVRADEPAAAPPADESVSSPTTEAVRAHYAEFVEKLDSALAESAPTDPAEQAISPQRWPWTGAAAVLGSFRPKELRPLPGAPVSDDSALTALADVVFTSADGRWVLEERVRARALERLGDRDALIEAADANVGLEDMHRDWIRRLASGEPPKSLATLDTRELGVIDTVTRWLEPLGLDLPIQRAALYAAVERRSLIDPLRKLVGTHFRGRAEELAKIDRHIRGAGTDPTIAIWGPGGSGKSSLLGKVLLELEDRIGYEPVSFAYVDFDKARHNPRNALGLVEQIARQLRLLYAANAETGRELSAAESISAGTDVDLAADVLDLDIDAAPLELDSVIEELSRRLDRIPRAHPTPLLLILDTFEEVQIQGPGAVEDVSELVKRFRAALPLMRVIVSGRGDLAALVGHDPDAILTLGDLDRTSADAVLESLGVSAPKIRALIYERFGGNPLTLHLAAEALARMGTAEKAFAGVLGEADALAAIGLEQIQGMLYDRILGHLGDPEIVRVARPGLAVRRVDVDVIRGVLAGPCDLDPNRAEAIFERLHLEVSMFELDDDGALRHRQDVRRLMLRAMMDDPEVSPRIAEIHRLAVDFYARQTGPKARAEEIYHRLMTGQDPRSLQSSWDPALREMLAPAVEDPLSAAARTWLSRRLGLIPDDDERAEWDQEDWEADAAERARSWLASNEAERAAEVLAERVQRLPGSRLYPLDLAVAIERGRLDEADAVLEAGMRSSIDAPAVQTQLELAEHAVKLATAKKDPAQVVAAAESAARLADLMNERLRGIDGLCGSVNALRQLGAAAEADRLADEISRRFSSLSATELREHPDLVRTVVQSAGPTESSVVAQAAVALGDVTADQQSVFRDDVFALSRVLESTVPEGRNAMNQLAVEVGLPQDKWTPRELAASAVQRGRTGKAVVVALDYAAEESATRQMIVDGLVRPAAAQSATALQG